VHADETPALIGSPEDILAVSLSDPAGSNRWLGPATDRCLEQFLPEHSDS
jgi:hypothetical protein